MINCDFVLSIINDDIKHDIDSNKSLLFQSILYIIVSLGLYCLKNTEYQNALKQIHFMVLKTKFIISLLQHAKAFFEEVP